MSETGSMVSSQRTTTSSRSRVSSRFFASSFPVFPIFISLEPSYHYLFTYTGVTIQFLQMLSFVLNTHAAHGETLKAVSKVIYASQLPLWDDSFVKLTFVDYLPFFFISVLMILATVVAGLWLVISRAPTQRDSATMMVLRGSLHLCTSVLFIPFMQGLLSQMFCFQGMLCWFPATKCYVASSSLVILLVSVLAFVLLNVMALLVESTLYVDDYHSQHPLARRQYINSTLYTVWRTFSCILFHVFMSNVTNAAPTGYKYTWLPMYIFFSAGLMSLSYVFYLPFLHQSTNRFFAAAFFVTGAIGFISFFANTGAISPRLSSEMRTSSFAQMDIDGLIVMSVGSICFYIGWCLADWRLNREMTRSLQQLTDAASDHPSVYTCDFPSGLPVYDMAYHSCMETCNEVADGAFKENRISLSLETPYLTSVWCYTDVEVATRFISASFRITGQYPTPQMLHLASQIYMKGMFRFPESSTVILDFATMINAFTLKPSLALAQCERVNAMACTFPSRYRAYRLMANLKLGLHLRDTAYQSTCEDAKRAHKEILVSLSQFWNKLLSPQTDRNQILTTYSMIARKRENTNHMFVMALQQQTSDRDLLLKYADFLDQVMLQPERATKLRALAVEEVEEEHRNRGQPVRFRQNQLRRRKALAIKAGPTDGGTQQIFGIRLDGQNLLRIVTLLVILLLAIALIVTSVVSYHRRVDTYRCVQYSGVARNLHVMADLVAMQYWSVGSSFDSSGPRLHNLASMATDMLSIHNFLSFGLPKSLTGIRERFFRTPRTINVVATSTTTTEYSVASFISLGYDTAQMQQDVPGVIGRETSKLSASVSGSQNALQAAAHLATAQSSVFNDYGRKWKSSGYNASVLACRGWYEEERDIFVIASAILFGFGVIFVVFYAEVSALLSPLEKLKNRILSLFGFIPRSKLQEIAQQAKLRVETFDQSNDAAGDDDNDRFAFQEPEEATSPGASPTASPNNGTHGTSSPNAEDGSSRGKKDGLDAKAGDGATAAGGAGADKRNDEDEYGENQALLWDTDRTDGDGDGNGGGGGGGFLSRIGRGRKSGDGSGADGGALTANGDGAPMSKRRSRQRTPHPILVRQQCLLLLFVVWLVVILIMAAGNSSYVTQFRSLDSKFARRTHIYSTTHKKAITGAVYLTSFFSSGKTTMHQAWLDKVDEVQTLLPSALSYHPEESEMTALRRAAEAVQAFSDNQEFVAAFADAVSGTTSTYNPVTGTADKTDAGEAARSSLFVSRGPLNEDPVVFTAMLKDMQAALVAADDAVLQQSTTHTLSEFSRTTTVVLISLSTAAFVCLVAFIAFIHFHNESLFVAHSRLGGVLFFFGAGTLLATMIVAILILMQLNSLDQLRGENVAITTEHRLIVQSYMWPMILAGTIAQEGEDVSLLSIFQYVDYVTVDTRWRTFANEQLSPADGAVMQQHGQRLLDFQLIALRLVATSSAMHPLELENVEWDFDAEPDAMETRLNYRDTMELRYTTTADDLSNFVPKKIMMARDVLSNQRAMDLVASLNAVTSRYFDTKATALSADTQHAIAKLSHLVGASIGTAAASVLTTSLFALVLLAQHAARRRQQLGLMREAFANDFSATRMWLGLTILLLFFAAVFVVNLVDLLGWPSRDAQFDYTAAKSFHIANGMISAELWSMGKITVTSLKTRYHNDWLVLDQLSDLLTSGSTNIYGISKPLDTLLKCQDVKLSRKFRYGYDPATAPAALTESGWTLPFGLDGAVAAWIHRSLEFAEAANTASAMQVKIALQTLRDAIMPLLRGLDESSSLLVEAYESRTRTFFVISVVLSVLLAVTVISFGACLIVPYSRQQMVEEVGYRMLVRLIPPEIRENIPAIREFMNHDSGKGSSAVASDSASAATSTAAAAMLSLNACDEISTAVIAINVKGVVIKFNRQAEDTFGYAAAEVLGNNVSLLMPERIGRRHDGYLANYATLRKPGNRSVFQQQELVARRKNGTLFDICMTVHEMRRGTEARAFLGFIEDISATVRARHEAKLNHFIQQESVMPMIAIDSLGTVLLFNKAAEECFGRSAEEVLDQNVKMLMPEDVAARHDGYLATYLRTREKHAIDSTARARALRKNGEEFPIELKVKEIVHDNVSTYVGFLRDLSTDAHLEEAVQINQVIFETSVVPVICTDMQGRVILYSRSAERVFGYTADEVVSNNCKMLMPDTVADRHDAILERYRTSWSKRNAPIMSHQVMARHKDGHLIPLLATLHEVKSTSTSNTALNGFFRELSEERSLERGLNIDEIIAEHHHVPLVVINSHGIIKKVNKSTVVEFGYSHPDDLLQRNVKMLMPDSVAARHDDYINRYLLTGIGSVITASRERDVLSAGRRFTAKRRDGNTFPVELRLREVRRSASFIQSVSDPLSSMTAMDTTSADGDVDGGNEEVHFIGFLRNLSRDVRLERQVAVNKAAMEHSPQALCLLDSHGAIVKVNPVAEHTFGTPEDSLLGRLFTEMLLPTLRTGAPRSLAGTRPLTATKSGTRGVPASRDNGIPPTNTEEAVALNGALIDPLVLMLGTTTRHTLVTQHGRYVAVDVTVRAVSRQRAEGGSGDVDVGPMCVASDDKDDSDDGEEGTAKRRVTTLTAQAYVVCLREVAENGAAEARAARNSQVAELCPVPLVQFDADGTVLTINQAAEKQLGYPREDVAGKHISTILPDPLVLADMLVAGAEDAAASLGAMNVAALEEKGSPRQKRVRTQMRTKKGQLVPVELCVAEAITYESAYKTRSVFVAYLYDQSGLVQLEAASAACQAYAELSTHPVVITDADGKITLCNAAACRSFRYPEPAAMVNNDVGILVPANLVAAHIGYIRAYQKTGEGTRVGRTMPVQCRRSDGSVFPCSLTVREVKLGEALGKGSSIDGDFSSPTTLLGQQRNLAGLDGVDPGGNGTTNVVYIARFVDRSEDGNVASAKTFMETLLRLSSAMPLLFFTQDGDVQRVSQRAIALLGYNAAEELTGRAASVFFTSEEVELPWEHVQAQPQQPQQPNLNSGTADDLSVNSVTVAESETLRCPVTVHRKNGSQLTAELHLRLISVGDLTSYVGCLVDAQEREALHEHRKTNLTLIEHSPIPVLIMDSTGAVQVFSPAAESFFGYSSTEIVSDDTSDVLMLLPEMAEDRAEVRAAHGDAATSGGSDSNAPSLASHLSSRGSNGESDAGLQRLLLAGAAAATTAVEAASGANGGRNSLSTRGPYAKLAVTLSGSGLLRGRHARLRHGTMVPVDVAVVELPPRDGNDDVRYLVFVVDRSLDSAVAVAQRLSDAVARSSPLPSLVVSDAGIILEANQHAADLIQYTVEELEGQTVSITVPFKSIAAATNTAEANELVYVRRNVPVLTRSGTTRMTDAHVCVLPARGSLPSSTTAAASVLCVTLVDHSATTDYHRIAQRFRTLFQSVSMPVLRVDAGSLRLLAFNPAADRMLGLTRAQSQPARKMAQALTAPTEDDEEEVVALPELMVDPQCVKQIRRFVVRELRRRGASTFTATTAAAPLTTEAAEDSSTTAAGATAPLLRLQTKVRVVGRSGEHGGNSGTGSLQHSSTGLLQSEGGHSASSLRKSTLTHGARGTARSLDVDLLVELVDQHLLVYVKNITAERRQQLHASLLTAMQSTLREPYMVVSNDDVIVSFNEVATRLLGYQLPPDGTIDANDIIEGGVISMYFDASAAEGGDNFEGGGSAGSDVVVASLELADTCAFAAGAGGPGNIMWPVVPVPPAAAPDRAFAPLPFTGNDDGATAGAGGSVVATSTTTGAGAPATPGGSAGDGMGETSHVLRTELRSRHRLVTKVPCRCKDGHTALLNLRLCEVEVPLASRSGRERGVGAGFSSPTVTDTAVTGSGSRSSRSASTDTAMHSAAALGKVDDGSDEASAIARYYVVFLQDISAKDHLDTNILLGEAIIEKNPSAIVVTNVQGTVVKFNAAAERLFKFERDHVLGKNVSLLMPQQFSARHDNYLEMYMRTRIQHVIGAPRQVVAECRDGEHVMVELNMLEVLDDNGVPYLFIGFLQAINQPASSPRRH